MCGVPVHFIYFFTHIDGYLFYLFVLFSGTEWRMIFYLMESGKMLNYKVIFFVFLSHKCCIFSYFLSRQQSWNKQHIECKSQVAWSLVSNSWKLFSVIYYFFPPLLDIYFLFSGTEWRMILLYYRKL